MKKYFALSRTPHSILDIATPSFCALLLLGTFPNVSIVLLSLATAFAGYTSIYALNDLIGVNSDKEKALNGKVHSGYSVEATDFHHPIAKKLLSFKLGFFWAILWFTIAIIGAYYLNPVIIIILFLGAILEFIYCSFLKITYLRTLISGIVKTCGPIAAIFVVTPSPSLYFLLIIFLWVFFWEIGGQNIPADWNDVEEDKSVNAKTIPVKFSPKVTASIILLSLIFTVIISLFLPLISPINFIIPYSILCLFSGYFLLLKPAINLYKTQNSLFAAKLFDKASYYPLTFLIFISLYILCFTK